SANYAVIATDREGTIEEFNPTAERWLGYARDEALGKLSLASFHDDGEVAAYATALAAELGEPVAPGFEAFVAKARRGAVDEREWTHVRKDGSRYDVLLSMTALRNKVGGVVGYVGIASDITAAKRARAD